MINIMQIGVGALVVATFLVGYGVKEENRARRDHIEELKQERAALEVDIALLQTEWSHLNSPAALDAVAARLDPVERARLTPVGPDRLARLQDLPIRPPGRAYAYHQDEAGDFGPREILSSERADAFDAALAFQSGSRSAALFLTEGWRGLERR